MAQRSPIRLFSALVVTFGALTVGCGSGSVEESQASVELGDDASLGSPGSDGGVTQSSASAVSRDDAGSSSSVARDGGASSGTERDGGSSGSSDSGAPAAASAGKTLRTDGKRILDTCGEPFVPRGMEQITAKAFSPDGTLTGLAAELAQTGSNAVRLLPTDEISASDLDALLTAFAAQRVVAYISPGDRAWFARADMREVLLRHESGLILDAFQEPNYEDVTRWLRETKAAIAELRSAGFSCPLTVLAPQFGRDLTTAIEHGQEVADSDTLHSVIVGWQAYWGNSGWYQSAHGMTLAEGVARCASMGFPMQVGIDLYADANDAMDYAAVMAAAQQHGIGWLWWNFWNEWDGMGNNATSDGTAEHLTPAGQAVVHSDPNSIERTAKKACFR